MGVLNRAADLAQKGTVLGLMSLFGYQVFQIGSNVMSPSDSGPKKNEHLEIMSKINETVEEEAKYKNSINTIPDRYDPDDDSYLKKLPNLNNTRR